MAETSWTQHLASGSTLTYHALVLNVPANAAAGAAIQVTVSREVERVAGHPVVDEDTLPLTVGSSTLSGTIAPATVSAQAGQTATATFSILPVNSPAGSVTVTSLQPGVTVTPSTFNLTAGQTAPVSVNLSFAIPAGTAAGATYDIPVVFQSNAGHGGAIMHIVVEGQPTTPDFTFTLDMASIFVTNGDSNATVTATATPASAFTGDITVTGTFPGASLSFTPPVTNPFVLHFAGSAGPQSQAFKIHFNSQQGFTPGDIVLTATNGAHTHTATLHVSAS